jgi:hypothetical protein
MSGGLRHHNDDEETGRAMRLDIDHRRSRIVTLSNGTSASALTGKLCAKQKDQEAKVP